MKKIRLFTLFALVFSFSFINVNALKVENDMVLDKDYTESFTVDGKEVTIDLNGHNVTTSGVALSLINGAKVTLKGKGTIRSTASNAVVVDSGSTFIMKDGKLESQEFGVATFEKATFTMDGGEIYTHDNCGAGGNGSNTPVYQDYTININGGVINANISSKGFVSCGIYHPNKGTVNMTGGTINSSNGAGIVQRAGVLNITGGTINTFEKTENIKGKVGDSRVVVPANAVIIDKDANYPALNTLKVTISGGAVLNGAHEPITVLGNMDNITITGGIYNEAPAEENVPEGHTAYQILSGENAGKFIIVNDDEVEYVVVDGVVSEEDIEETDAQLIADAIKDKFDVASYYIIELKEAAPTGEIIGEVTEATEAQEITLGIPQALPAVKEGYTRKFAIVRIHNGETTIMENVTVEGNLVKGKSDKFSTYALVYTDVKNEEPVATPTPTTEEVPKTYDGITNSILVVTTSAFVLAGTIVYMKKKFN